MTVRLSINLADDVAAALGDWADKKCLSYTEAVRRAIAVWNFVETEIANGNKIAVVEADSGRIREVVVVE
jgi:predicted transcriptional regulator